MCQTSENRTENVCQFEVQTVWIGRDGCLRWETRRKRWKKRKKKPTKKNQFLTLPLLRIEYEVMAGGSNRRISNISLFERRRHRRRRRRWRRQWQFISDSWNFQKCTERSEFHESNRKVVVAAASARDEKIFIRKRNGVPGRVCVCVLERARYRQDEDLLRAEVF